MVWLEGLASMRGMQLGDHQMQSSSVGLHNTNKISREELEMLEEEMWTKRWCP